MPGEVIGLIGNNGAGKSTLLNAIGGLRAGQGHRRAARPRREPQEGAPARPRSGSAARSRPRASIPSSPCATPSSSRSRRAQSTSFWGSLLWVPSIRAERTKHAEAGELIDFLGLGRYADRYVAELSTGTRRIVELATRPRRRAAGDLPRRADRRGGPARGGGVRPADPAACSRSSTPRCRRRARPAADPVDQRPRSTAWRPGGSSPRASRPTIRNDPRVIASYLGTDERAIQRSNAPAR